MSLSEVVSAAKLAGFQGDDLVLICAIAGRESGWSADATNNTARPGWGGYRELTDAERERGIVPEYSVGAWQINLEVHNLTESQARDYQQAAQYAHYLAYNTPQGFRHWSTWRGVVEDGLDTVDHQAIREEIARQSENAPDDDSSSIAYTVQPGDTLWALAARILGDANRWPEIQAKNGLPDTIIRVGQVLTIDVSGEDVEPTPEPTPPVIESPPPTTIPNPPTLRERLDAIKAEIDAANADLAAAFSGLQPPAGRLMNAFAELSKLAEEIGQ